MEEFINDVVCTGNSINHFLKVCINRIDNGENFDYKSRIFEFQNTQPFAMFTELGISSLIIEIVEESEIELKELGYDFSWNIFRSEDDAIVKVYVTKID